MNNGKISLKQIQALLTLNIFGPGAVLLPGLAAGFAGNDGYIVIVGGTFAALIYVLIINRLSGMFPGESFAEYSRKIAGGFLGFFLSFFLSVKLIITAGAELRLFGEIMKEWLLFQTPVYVTCGAMAALCVFAGYRGLIARARIGELLIYLIFLPIIVLMLSSAVSADFTQLRPFFKASPSNLLAGSVFTSFSFRGVAFALLVYPYALKPKKVGKAIAEAVLVSGGLLLALTITVFGKLGPDYAKVQLWPALRVMDTIDFPGKILERQDGFILSFWIVTVFIAVGGGVFFSSLIFGKILGNRPVKTYLIPNALLIFLVAMAPDSAGEAVMLLNLIDIALGPVYLFLVPLLLYLTARVRKLGNIPCKEGLAGD